eukprot:TRINITY_DN12054_c0_g1_i2.p1 TRINITY_DN12054_c0_g1~~TRINITY_DN12054_c0_g1_i2.p1  ORF type:complete len:489 (+),score=136.25 TRINITY_DN12054_c0_g1_i2:89-1555(+)
MAEGAAAAADPGAGESVAAHSAESWHELSGEDAAAFREELLRWYDRHRRRLPWRGDPPPYGAAPGGAAPGARQPVTPYATWISEVMCQQTRVETVIPYYTRWMQLFPNPVALAAATPEAVNAAWAGLGYYRRARMLHQAAKQLSKAPFYGELPQDTAELKRIPGIGDYTAAAVASLAYGRRAAVVDGNVLRVLTRLCGVAAEAKHAPFRDRLAPRLAAALIDPARPGDFNQAIMELGATLCTPQWAPDELPAGLRRLFRCCAPAPAPAPGAARGCAVCSAGAGRVAAGLRERRALHQLLPVAPAPQTAAEEHAAVLVLRRPGPSGPEWLLLRRPKSRPPRGAPRSAGLLSGQWEFPCAPCSAEDSAAGRGALLCAALGELIEGAGAPPRRPLPRPVRHAFSGVKLSYWVESAPAPAPDPGAPRRWRAEVGGSPREAGWLTAEEMEREGATAGVLKIREAAAAAARQSTLPVGGAGKRRRTDADVVDLT